MRQKCDRLQMLMLHPQSLRRREIARVEIALQLRVLLLPELSELLWVQVLRGLSRLNVRHFAVVCEQLLEVFRTQNADLGEEELALHQRCVGVVQHGPDRHQVFQLPSRLLYHAILTLEHNGHSTEVLDFGATDDQGVDVESSCGENPRHAGQDTRLVLDQTVEDMALGRGLGWERSFVEDARDGSRGRDIAGGRGRR